MLKSDSMGGQGCLTFICYHYDITICLMTMKTTYMQKPKNQCEKKVLKPFKT